jgi:NadR type nicotinamide-nucleotide adenylyltransferase
MHEIVKKIVITGPESTGKSILTQQLAQHYNTVFIPEYARFYIENLNRKYNFNDIEHIAQQQVVELEKMQLRANKFIFIDTYLIITKVWFDVVYKTCPQWIIDRIQKNEIDLYLLCNTELPWFPDKVRENGGEMRDTLFQRYIDELENFGLKYAVITGTGINRTQNAIFAINNFFSL